MEEKPCTKKEELFCLWYGQLAQPLEAAEKAGFAPQQGLALLQQPRIQKRLEELQQEKNKPYLQALTALERIAYGQNNDAITLATRLEELTLEDLKALDVFNISKVKQGKSGLEIDFYDRLSALELLLEESKLAESKHASTLLHAIEESAQAFAEKEEFHGD